jgi:inorganic pyrophosphatase
MHPWHDIVLPALRDDAEFPAVIEVPQGTKNKYELDKATGFLRVDRVLFSAMRYPANYGFIPRTLAEDGDPLDVLVLGQEPVAPLAFLHARAIGAISMRDEKGVDDKIICVHVNDPTFREYSDIADIPRHLVVEISRFLEDYKELELKLSEIGPAVGKREALEIVRRAAERYEREIGVRAASVNERVSAGSS